MISVQTSAPGTLFGAVLYAVEIARNASTDTEYQADLARFWDCVECRLPSQPNSTASLLEALEEFQRLSSDRPSRYFPSLVFGRNGLRSVSIDTPAGVTVEAFQHRSRPELCCVGLSGQESAVGAFCTLDGVRHIKSWQTRVMH